MGARFMSGASAKTDATARLKAGTSLQRVEEDAQDWAHCVQVARSLQGINESSRRYPYATAHAFTLCLETCHSYML